MYMNNFIVNAKKTCVIVVYAAELTLKASTQVNVNMIAQTSLVLKVFATEDTVNVLSQV